MNLGGRNRIWARFEVSWVEIGEFFCFVFFSIREMAGRAFLSGVGALMRGGWVGGGGCVISSVLTGHWLARTFSLAWRSGGLLLLSPPKREITAKKGSSKK